MKIKSTYQCIVLIISLCAIPALAQDLDPRAYSRVPVGISILTAGGAYSEGSILTDPTLPLENLEAMVVNASVGFGHTFSLFGQTAQALVVLPYAWVDASATVFGEYQTAERSGLADARIRLSFLPVGAPAATISEFGKVPRSTIIGTSLTIIIPIGQFDSTKLINIGAHRWTFKPEIAVSQPLGDKWDLDIYAGLWLFTTNNTFYPGTSERSQDPMASFQAHVSYAFTPKMWAAFNTTYYVGGKSYVNGKGNDDLQNNVRVGATMVVPIGQQHSIRAAASTGAVVRFGANFTTLSLAWQTVF